MITMSYYEKLYNNINVDVSNKIFLKSIDIGMVIYRYIDTLRFNGLVFFFSLIFICKNGFIHVELLTKTIPKGLYSIL